MSKALLIAISRDSSMATFFKLTVKKHVDVYSDITRHVTNLFVCSNVTLLRGSYHSGYRSVKVEM